MRQHFRIAIHRGARQSVTFLSARRIREYQNSPVAWVYVVTMYIQVFFINKWRQREINFLHAESVDKARETFQPRWLHWHCLWYDIFQYNNDDDVCYDVWEKCASDQIAYINNLYKTISGGGQLKARQVSLGTTKEIVNNLR